MKLVPSIYLISLLLLADLPFSYSQDIQFALKAGPQITGVKIDPGVDDDNKIGFHAGVTALFELSDVVLLQPEASISFQGDEVDGLTYLNLPVVAKYFLSDQISVHTGVQIGILLGGEDNIEDFVKTADLGIPLGGEYQINESFGVGLRYILGVTDIVDFDSNVKLFNRVFQIFATYNLN